MKHFIFIFTSFMFKINITIYNNRFVKTSIYFIFTIFKTFAILTIFFFIKTLH